MEKVIKDYEAYCTKCEEPIAGASKDLKFMIEGLPCPFCGSRTVVREVDYD